MESTGIYHLPLLHYLVKRGLVCHAVNPVRIKHHIQPSALRKSKIDIKGMADRLFPELSKNTSVFTRSILHLLLQAPSCKLIRSLKEKKIARILQEASGNKATLSAKEILGWAKGSIGINDTGLEIELQSKIRRLLPYDVRVRGDRRGHRRGVA